MKAFRFFIVSVAALGLVATNGQTGSPSAPTGDPAAAQEIRGWLDHWRKGVSAKDVDRVMELYTEDVLAYDLVPPLQYIGKAAYRADLATILRPVRERSSCRDARSARRRYRRAWLSDRIANDQRHAKAWRKVRRVDSVYVTLSKGKRQMARFSRSRFGTG